MKNIKHKITNFIKRNINNINFILRRNKNGNSATKTFYE